MGQVCIAIGWGFPLERAPKSIRRYLNSEEFGELQHKWNETKIPSTRFGGMKGHRHRIETGCDMKDPCNVVAVVVAMLSTSDWDEEPLLKRPCSLDLGFAVDHGPELLAAKRRWERLVLPRLTSKLGRSQILPEERLLLFEVERA